MNRDEILLALAVDAGLDVTSDWILAGLVGEQEDRGEQSPEADQELIGSVADATPEEFWRVL